MFKKLTAFVMALCVIGGTALYAPEKPLNIITANAVIPEVTEGSLTFYVYAGNAEVCKCDESAEGEIIIPAEINGVPVTSIGERVFDFCIELTSINIPESVTSIGICAFEGCAGLTSINIPESVTSIGESAFWGCTGLTSINIPAGVTSIGDMAFHNCTELTSINIPDGVTSIGNGAFANCTELTSINIPDSVTIIGGGVFANCTELTSISIPDSVTGIGGYAFENCSSLSSIIIPESVTSINEYAFSYCTNLKEITILNPDCKIYYTSNTISNGKNSFDGTIYGYENSTAQFYAEEYGYKFAVIGDEAPVVYLAGDANGDGDVSISDAVAILQNLANADEYPLSEQGKLNADVDGVAGVTGKDAAVIQMYDAGVVTSLPV